MDQGSGNAEEHVREIQRRPGNKYRWEIVCHATHMRSAEKYVKDSICKLLQNTAQYLQNTTKHLHTHARVPNCAKQWRGLADVWNNTVYSGAN